ncbi:MAG TPA: sigma-70 family RNA polymerase sigma factor [Acidimicrobiales bacterium]|nr:sigma-70 family RNA polymerase sigma factor [Acidimicrobiales bacterium]
MTGASFDALFKANFSAVTAYARRRASGADADDVVAEVFTAAWRRMGDIPVGRELPWLYGVARRTLANQRRGAARRLRLVDRVAREPTRETALNASGAIADAFARLRPDDREVLRLAAWEQLTAAEIAVVLGCSPNAAALRLSRARHKLREVLTETSSSRTQDDRSDTDA